ncbi:unnamed protein product [Meloidogyne enterolobii]|uniref:Uncharacterized protein n=1 Tax=Meloidogyne enterolobii TaxID=390850 RepID=A0ACB0ZRB6_MELEN
MDNSSNTIKEIENKANIEMLEKILENQLSYKNVENNENEDKGKGKLFRGKDKENKGKGILCTNLLFCGSSSYGKETPSD